MFAEEVMRNGMLSEETIAANHPSFLSKKIIRHSPNKKIEEYKINRFNSAILNDSGFMKRMNEAKEKRKLASLDRAAAIVNKHKEQVPIINNCHRHVYIFFFVCWSNFIFFASFLNLYFISLPFFFTRRKRYCSKQLMPEPLL